MKFTFYKDNKISGKFQKSASQILREYNETEESKLDMPFERKILNFMMVNYGSFDTLTDEHWDELYKRKTKIMKTSNLKCGEIINAIGARIKSGEYDNFPSTKQRLENIQIELLKKAVEITDNDYQTLVSEKYITDSNFENSQQLREDIYRMDSFTNTLDSIERSYQKVINMSGMFHSDFTNKLNALKTEQQEQLKALKEMLSNLKK